MKRLSVILSALSLLSAIFFPAVSSAKTLYLGGAFSLTGAYAEDCAAVLAAFDDYARYVNETKQLAPWRTERFPQDITLEVLWRDDELKPAKALSIYDELKAKRLLVFSVTGSGQAIALKERPEEHGMGSVSLVSGSFLLKPPGTIFTNYAIYTDCLAAIADWFKSRWKEKKNPRVAYLPADNPIGKSIEIPEMETYLRNTGYEFVGRQYVPLIATTPPPTQLMWLKENKVDLAIGVMINPGLQPTLKEALRLSMGENREYRITFWGVGTAQVNDLVRDLGEVADGYVSAGSLLPWTDPSVCVKFCLDLQKTYRSKPITCITYQAGVILAMIQTEALRLALKEIQYEKLTPRAVLEHGFYKIRNLDTGELTATPLTFGLGKVEGTDKVLLIQVQRVNL